MQILSDRTAKKLFLEILLCIVGFVILSAIFAQVAHKAIYLFFAAIVMAGAISGFCYRYIRAQTRAMEDAAEKLKEYSKGNTDVRIVCDDEGKLNQLFHEINSLAAILQAHAQKDARAKEFLKHTISDISHQLKTPLAALQIYNGILQDDTIDAAERKEFIALSEQELDRIEILVQTLLKISKLDAGAITMERRPENVYQLLERIQSRFAVRAEQEGKRLVLSGDTTVPFLCDAAWLTEAFANIVKNALDHTMSGDRITIACRNLPSIVQIVITDAGSGIHPEDLHHIFKRFYRSRFSKDTQGAGLGLPLAKAVIEAHNGTVEVDSEPGKGTAFTVNLLR